MKKKKKKKHFMMWNEFTYQTLYILPKSITIDQSVRHQRRLLDYVYNI